MTLPYVSIVLVTKNGGHTLPAVLDAIETQDVTFPFEVVVVDSGSTDNTRALLESRVDLFVTIPPREFNHGLTRNLAISRARGELVVLLVQDAAPASRSWLDALTRPFSSDPELAGTFCRQIARPDASALTRCYLSRWFAHGEAPRRVALSHPDALDSLPPLVRLDTCTFDNVCSCIRRSAWQAHPFARTSIAEDLEWAATVLRAGYALAYVPDAVVIHSHDRSAGYEFGRTYTLHRRLFELFGAQTIPTPAALVRAVAASLRLHVACLRRADAAAAGAVWRALALACAWPAGQYLGALSAKKGWRPFHFRNV